MSRLTHRQQRFCDLVVKYPDKTWEECCSIAGYSKHRAKTTASELMSKPLIVEYMERIKKPIIKKYQLGFDRYIDELLELRDRARADNQKDLEHRIIRTIMEAEGIFVKQTLVAKISASKYDNMTTDEIDQKLCELLNESGVELKTKELLEDNHNE